MWDGLKRSWRAFAASKPGSRFQDGYRRHRRGMRRRTLRVVVTVLAAIVLVAIGLVGLVVPGPGTLFIAAGVALVGRESLPVAKLLDKVELKLRPAMRWVHERWRRLRGR